MTALNIYTTLDPDEPPSGLSDCAAEYWGRLVLEKPTVDQREKLMLTRIAKLLDRGELAAARVAMAELGVGAIGRSQVIYGPSGSEATGLMRQRLYFSLPPREVQAIDRRLRSAGLRIDAHGDLLPIEPTKTTRRKRATLVRVI